jgi:SAM-dependent methyltransferase
MLLPNMRSWLGLGHATGAERPVRAHEPARHADGHSAPKTAVVENSNWPPHRLEVVDSLWGKGFQFPGGEAETLHLAKPLGLSSASSLILLGAGSGGPPCAIANKLGVWMTGFESDPDLVLAATERSLRVGLARRAQIENWDPEHPNFERNQYHHGMALEPLRDGLPEPTLAALAQALKPGGQLVLTETVADAPLDPVDPVIAAWRRLEKRRVEALPSEISITRVLGRLGFDVRIVEDVSQRHIRQALFGWRQVVRGMEHAPPTPRDAAQLVQEAEMWLLRMKLLRARKLRLVRWNAIGRG